MASARGKGRFIKKRELEFARATAVTCLFALFVTSRRKIDHESRDV